MSYNDEFEDLIRNFKLDDVDGEPPRQAAQAPPSRTPQKMPARATAAHAAPARTQSPTARAEEQKPARPVSRTQQPVKREPPPDPARLQRGGGSGGMPPRPPHEYEPEEEPDEENEYEEQDGVLSGVGRWTKALIVLAVALAVSAFLAMFALAVAGDMFGLNQEDREIAFELPEGELGLGDVAALLKEQGIVSQPFAFQVYAGLKSNSKFIPGTYELNTNMSYDQIMVKFRSGNHIVEEVKVTFYEGMTLSQMAQKLEENEVCKADDLYKFLESSEMKWEYRFLSQVPDQEQRFRRFEGYLFPDTYIFEKNEDIGTVVQKFFNNFNQKITPEIEEQAKARGMTVDQLLTLASIIQKEAAQVPDMKMVSSVFQNRMANAQTFPTLDSDVTVFYVEDDIKPFVGGQSGKRLPNDPKQPIYDAYNTYVCKGLPVGPICNPGMDAIQAVLEPSDSKYLFFIADKEGVFHFAETLDEHNRNIAEAGDEVHGVNTEVGREENLG